MNLLKLREAAEQIGVSYPTLKQWIYANKIQSVKTVGGHHRIPQSEIDRLLRAGEKRNSAAAPDSLELHTISGRNKLRGTITDVRFEGLLAQVEINVGGQMTSIVTADAARSLDLNKGAVVYALVKAT